MNNDSIHRNDLRFDFFLCVNSTHTYYTHTFQRDFLMNDLDCNMSHSHTHPQIVKFEVNILYILYTVLQILIGHNKIWNNIFHTEIK